MIGAGAILTLDIDKPAAGGRMLARHDGQVVLVSHAIPGERVRARVERSGKGVAFAETVDVLTSSPDRRDAADWKCGGNVLAHVAYARQLTLKGEILQDAFARIGRLPLAAPPDVIGSPERGYRMRARLHVTARRIGFYREGTHELCDPASTGQLLESTIAWLRDVEARLAARRGDQVRGLEFSEDMSGAQRAAFLDADDGVAPAWFAELAGPPEVVDSLPVPDAPPLALHRGARSFFQGNRYLLERITQHVAALVPDGPVIDLYAGVGLFGLALAARGRRVTLVEGDHASGADLVTNAQPYLDRVRVHRTSVEHFLAAKPDDASIVIDPPRTGLSKDATAGLLRHHPRRLIYVSCDPATLARDSRALLDAGYELLSVTGIDLFPNTAHVEAIALFRT